MNYCGSFGIEKYLEQMRNNPYVDELKEDLREEKNKFLNLYLKSTVIQCLTPKQESYILNLEEQHLETLCHTLNDISTDLSSTVSRKIQEFQKNMQTLQPTKLRISTMTICCQVGGLINTTFLYNSFVIPHNILNTNDKLKKKYKPELSELFIGCKAEDYAPKGYFEKEKKKNFFNSASLNLLIYDNKCINIKVFKNGQLQMTGVPSEQYGRRAAECVIQLFRSIPNKCTPDGVVQKIVDDKSQLGVVNFKTCMINSDYYCGTPVRRDNLHYILEHKYDLSANFEPENYQGAKLEYFWNTSTVGSPHEGKCMCEKTGAKKCIGKGGGFGIGDCKKITISTFQSGKVIVTGGRSLQQLEDAYRFINVIFRDNFAFIKKSQINSVKSSDNIFIKKHNITNKEVYDKLRRLFTQQQHREFSKVS